MLMFSGAQLPAMLEEGQPGSWGGTNDPTVTEQSGLV